MDKYQPTTRERIFNFIFSDSKLGHAIIAAICITLFILLLGVGYIAAGLFLLAMAIRHEEKTGDRPSGTSGGLGTVLVWPVAVMMLILHKD